MPATRLRDRVIVAAILSLGVLAFALPTASAAADPADTYQAVPSGRYPIDLATTADGAQLFVISRGDGGDADLRVYDTTTMSELSVIDFGPATSFNPTAVEVSGDGSQVWVSFYNPGQILVYPTADLVAGGTPTPTTITAGGGFVDLDAAPGSPYMYAATLFNPQYQFQIANPLAAPRTISLPASGSRGVAERADGTEVYFTAFAAAPTGGVFTVEVAGDGSLTGTTVLPTGDQPWGIAYNEAQNRVASTNSGTPTSVTAFTPGSPTLTTLPVSCGPRLLDASPDGARIYIACLTGGIVVHDYTQDTDAAVAVGGAVESVRVWGAPDGPAQRVYATSGATDEVLVFTRPTIRTIVDQTVQEGQDAVFQATVDDYWQTIQWQRSTDGGLTWTDVPGAQSGTLTVTSAPLAASGTRYRLVARSALFEDVISAPATLTVTPIPVPSLPATGVDARPQLLSAGAALAIGAALLLLSRRRRT